MSFGTDTGGPAFPRPAGDFNGTRHGNGAQSGMTLRDYFAAKAMQAVIVNSDQGSVSIGEVDLWIGSYAYSVADAMLKARQE